MRATRNQLVLRVAASVLVTTAILKLINGNWFGATLFLVAASCLVLSSLRRS